VKEFVFVDTDVCLDLLTGRPPHHSPASLLFTLADQKQLDIYVSALSFSNIHYILRQNYSMVESRKILTRFKVLTKVLAVNEKIIELALQSDFKDFEDAIQYHTAIEHNLNIILTRNLKDYRPAKIPVMTAEEFLKSMNLV
jgi:predicted nucleic acid-binding protein